LLTPETGITESTALVEYELLGGCAWIRLNRPHALNAVVPDMVRALCDSFLRAAADNAEVAVLSGNGTSFCSGFDLKQGPAELTELEHRVRIDQTNDVTRLMRVSPFITVSAVHGFALGQGCEFALAADIVVADESATFGFPEVTWGLSVTGGISALLVEAVGHYRAKRLLLLGEQFTARQACEWGLVSEPVAAGSALEHSRSVAERVMSLPRHAIIRTKRLIDITTAGRLEVAYALESEHAILAGRAPESAQAMDGYKGARHPSPPRDSKS
jgi:2-(1,2-epoxy-1,2-dihydrophenyl)acetyl-CoA isomerase